MTIYALKIHHRGARVVQDNKGQYKISESTCGHFYISLVQEEQTPVFFGKYPKDDSIFGCIVGAGKISTKQEQLTHAKLLDISKKLDKKYVHTKGIILTTDEYNKAITFSMSCIDGNGRDNFYFIGYKDCRHFVQDVWHAIGKPLYFSVIYNKNELISILGTEASKALLLEYGSSDTMLERLCHVEAISKENLAKTLNIDPTKYKITEIPRFKYWDLHYAVPAGSTLILYHIDADAQLIIQAREGLIESDDISSVMLSLLVKQQKIQIAELHELFLSKKIPPENAVNNVTAKAGTSKELAINQDLRNQENPKFIELKENIIKSLNKSKIDFDKILERVATSYSSQSSSSKTQEAILAEYKTKITELQIKSKTIFDEAQKDPSKYKYEIGDTIAGMAYHNREEMKLNQWLSEQLSQVSVSTENRNTAQAEEKKKSAIKAWNTEIENLSAKRIFHEDIEQSIAQVNTTGEIIVHEMDMFLQGVDKEMFL